MPSVIIGRMLNVGAPGGNAGCFIGSYNFAGWDANVKQSHASGADMGAANIVIRQTNITFDHAQMVDDAINSQDVTRQRSENA